MGGTITGASNVTIRNSSFSSTLDIEGSTAGVVIDRDQFTWNAVSSNGGPNAKIFLHTSGTLNAPAVTISNSSIINGDLDGIHVGGGSGVQIVGNTFSNLCDRNVNHTDNIQFEGGTQVRIAQNYFYAAQNCPTQGVTSYDSGTNGVIIEDNVVDVPRDWGIELYADKNSIVRHNTVVYHPKSYSEFNTGTGQIDINRKSEDPAGSGTQVYDNLTSGVSFANGSTGTQHNNVNNSTAKYVGPTTQWAGFKLAADSPVGRNAASDGADAGVRVAGGTDPQPTPTPSPSPSPSPTPTPTPTPTPPPNDHPAAAVWAAPSSATVGTPVTLDGTASSGDGSLSCTWSFENEDGSTIWETQTGCKLQKAFTVADTKYVKLIVRDADGDTDSDKQSFRVTSAQPPAPTPTPEPPAPTPTPTPDPPGGGTPAPDQPAHAVLTMPRNVRKGVAVTFDGTRSTGDGTVTCTWTFSSANAKAAKLKATKKGAKKAKAKTPKATKSQVVKGCSKRKTFNSSGTSSVKLVVRDADGDTDSTTRTVTVR
jgi:Right handed beta helix region/PKD domain